MTALLEVQHATRRFAGLVAVNDVSFTLAAGEILGLIGPNGAGKSTTFNLVTGVLPATSGEVTLLDRRIDAMRSRKIARLALDDRVVRRQHDVDDRVRRQPAVVLGGQQELRLDVERAGALQGGDGAADQA